MCGIDVAIACFATEGRERRTPRSVSTECVTGSAQKPHCRIHQMKGSEGMKEDESHKCPKGFETATGHYDPAGPDGGKCKSNIPLCAGCGLPWGQHVYKVDDG